MALYRPCRRAYGSNRPRSPLTFHPRTGASAGSPQSPASSARGLRLKMSSTLRQ